MATELLKRLKKCPKYIITVMFCNKGMEQINLNGILKYESYTARLPGKNSAPRKYYCGYILVYNNNKK